MLSPVLLLYATKQLGLRAIKHRARNHLPESPRKMARKKNRKFAKRKSRKKMRQKMKVLSPWKRTRQH
jgi:hypothetical protein